MSDLPPPPDNTDRRTYRRLRDVAFFEGFDDDDLTRVATLANEIEVEEGARLIDQGRHPALECYVILHGRTSVQDGDEPVATLEEGSMVGEMALIDHRPRSATVVAETPMTTRHWPAAPGRSTPWGPARSGSACPAVR
jgi:CRP/FNR family cyclic AMP-dependent transcriptional regulator